MLNVFLKKFQNTHDLGPFFVKLGIVSGAIFIGILWWLRPRSPESSFRVREADLRARRRLRPKDPGLGDRTASTKPLGLSGISIYGAPHEVLGIASDSSIRDIQKAYRNLMKRYHPDKVGRSGSREWNDAQKIAEAINRAKEQMLKQIHTSKE